MTEISGAGGGLGAKKSSCPGTDNTKQAKFEIPILPSPQETLPDFPTQRAIEGQPKPLETNLTPKAF
jgi:hypothetical protein